MSGFGYERTFSEGLLNVRCWLYSRHSGGVSLWRRRPRFRAPRCAFEGSRQSDSRLGRCTCSAVLLKGEVTHYGGVAFGRRFPLGPGGGVVYNNGQRRRIAYTTGEVFLFAVC